MSDAGTRHEQYQRRKQMQRATMTIPNDLLHTVAFLTYRNHQTDNYAPVGTMFFLGTDPIDGSTSASRVYAVTAGHVITKLRALGALEVYVRMNLASPVDGAWRAVIATNVDDWFTHPTDQSIDVAIIPMGIPSQAEQRVLPFSLCMSDKAFIWHEIGLGDEVVVTGLFHHHEGKSRNVPIVRVGNLAATNHEPVSTALGEMDAYLIEARSIGGLSGSPVFLNLGTSRVIAGQMQQASSPIFFLLGLIHGHFDVDHQTLDAADGLHTSLEKINSGIAIVTPIRHVRELIDMYEELHPPMK